MKQLTCIETNKLSNIMKLGLIYSWKNYVKNKVEISNLLIDSR